MVAILEIDDDVSELPLRIETRITTKTIQSVTGARILMISSPIESITLWDL